MRVFIASPFRGATPEQQEANVEKARELLRYAVRLGYAPFAPHLLYPGALNDADELERNQGIRAGMVFLQTCEQLWWYDGPLGVTAGMRKELELADILGIPIRKVVDGGKRGESFTVWASGHHAWKTK